MAEVPAFIDLITRGGLLSALVVALIGGMRGWYIWGTQHKEIVQTLTANADKAIADKDDQIDELRKDRDYWRTQAMTALSTTGRAVGVVEATSRRHE